MLISNNFQLLSNILYGILLLINQMFFKFKNFIYNKAKKWKNNYNFDNKIDYYYILKEDYKI